MVILHSNNSVYKTGGSSAYFDGSDDSITLPSLNITDDLTIVVLDEI